MKKLLVALFSLGLIFSTADAATYQIKNGDSLRINGIHYVLKNGKLALEQSDLFPLAGSGETVLTDRDPTASEPLAYGQILLNSFWVNTTTGAWFRDVDDTPDALKWDSIPRSPFNYSGVSTEAAWTFNFPSLAFNTARTASTESNVTVTASFSQSSTVLTPAIVNAQEYISAAWVTVGVASLSGLLTTQTNSITFDVPKDTQYRFVSASGSNSISLITETIK